MLTLTRKGEKMKVIKPSFEILDELNSRGIRFSLSNVLRHKGNHNTILSKWLDSNDYYVHHLSKDYSNSSYHLKNRGETETDEVLVTNYICR